MRGEETEKYNTFRIGGKITNKQSTKKKMKTKGRWNGREKAKDLKEGKGDAVLFPVVQGYS